MASILIESQYLPTIDFFCELVHAEEVWIEAYESYQRQTYRNRTKILSANSIIDLIIPIKGGRKHIPIKNVEIDHEQKWLNQHLRSIRSAYGKAPFFEHYWDYFDVIFEKKHQNLFDLNWETMTTCLTLLGISKEVKLTNDYHNTLENNVLDLRSVYSPKNKNMPNWQYNYYQIFGNKFVKGMSILDLLFCAGPESKQVIYKAIKTKS